MIAAVSQVFATAALGAVAGVFGGLFGIGGGVLAIPLLGMVFGLEQQAAQGTTLIMVVPNVLFGFWRYRQRFGVDLRMAAVIAGSALVSTYPTARFATGLDPHILRLAFALFLPGLQASSPIAPGAKRQSPPRGRRSLGDGRQSSAWWAGSSRGCSGSAAPLSRRQC